MARPSRTLRIGAVQRSAVELYLLDPAVVDGALAFGDPVFPGRLTADALVLDPGADPEQAREALTGAINSADDDGDAELRGALEALVRRVREALET